MYFPLFLANCEALLSHTHVGQSDTGAFKISSKPLIDYMNLFWPPLSVWCEFYGPSPPGVLPQLHWHRQLWCDGGLAPVPPLHLQHWDRPAQVQHLLHGRREPPPSRPEDLNTHSPRVHPHQHDKPHHIPGKCQTRRSSICWIDQTASQPPAPLHEHPLELSFYPAWCEITALIRSNPKFMNCFCWEDTWVLIVENAWVTSKDFSLQFWTQKRILTSRISSTTTHFYL